MSLAFTYKGLKLYVISMTKQCTCAVLMDVMNNPSNMLEENTVIKHLGTTKKENALKS